MHDYYEEVLNVIIGENRQELEMELNKIQAIEE